ncbi:DUF4352 domain-containing protein [Rhodococcus sp. X156]|uniref:DUF4352 domain-containing protein n=1 Tax=Rhodococcus sp. X156 TaxID=2499145 RepID=UPI000FD84401|nr:DUF4352 domain-containing protein [Rhodococcus sp. X156]
MNTLTKKNLRNVLAVTALIGGVVATTASGETNQATKVDGGGGEAPAAAQEFRVGDVVELGDWRTTVHAVTDPYTSSNQFLQAKPGNRLLTVDTEVRNQSTKPATVSSIMCFELQDSQNKSFNLTITDESTAGLDGELAPGAAKRGTLAYEVPATSTGLRLQFKCDLLSSGSATITLS